MDNDEKVINESVTSYSIMGKSILGTKKFRKKKLLLSKIRRKFLSNIWLARVLSLLATVLILFFAFKVLSALFESISFPKRIMIPIKVIFSGNNDLEKIDSVTNIFLYVYQNDSDNCHFDRPAIYSYSHTEKKLRVILISDSTELSEIYCEGEKKQAGGGEILVRSKIETFIENPINYHLSIKAGFFDELARSLSLDDYDSEPPYQKLHSRVSRNSNIFKKNFIDLVDELETEINTNMSFEEITDFYKIILNNKEPFFCNLHYSLNESDMAECLD